MQRTIDCFVARQFYRTSQLIWCRRYFENKFLSMKSASAIIIHRDLSQHKQRERNVKTLRFIFYYLTQNCLHFFEHLYVCVWSTDRRGVHVTIHVYIPFQSIYNIALNRHNERKSSAHRACALLNDRFVIHLNAHLHLEHINKIAESLFLSHLYIFIITTMSY